MVLKRASHFRDRFAHPRGNLTLSLHSPRLRGSGSERSWPECRWDHSEQASRVCTVDWISLNESRLKCHCLSIVYVYASSDCGRHEAKIRFYRDSSWSLRSASTTEPVVIAGHLNTTFYLLETERRILVHFSVPCSLINSGDRLVQACFTTRQQWQTAISAIKATLAHLALSFDFTSLDPDLS